MDETGVMLSMLGSAKVLIGKEDLVTAIECISADGRALLPLIIWPASTHLRANQFHIHALERTRPTMFSLPPA